MTGRKLPKREIACLLAVCCLAGAAFNVDAVSVESVDVVAGSRSMEVDVEEAADGGMLEGIQDVTPETTSASETMTEPEAAEREAGGSETDTSDNEETGADVKPETVSESETEPESESETETESPIDFEGLWEINTDIYAWIQIPGTVISYPVLQSLGAEDFYLTHDIEGNEDIYGSIYTQRYNEKDFSDFHTILYGHNMKDDTMFGWLSELADLETLWNHNVIYIYLPDRTLEYWIFAAYVSDNMHQLGGVNTRSRKDRQEYLDKVEARCEDVQTFDRRLFDKVTADSHILTLSTCYQNDPEHRFLVQAVLVEQPDPGSLPEMEKPKTLPEPEGAESETESELTAAELAAE